MRPTLPLLLIVVLASALSVQAQPSPVVTGDPTPDTTDWRRYFPLEIGNEWQYRIDYPDDGTGYYSYDIVGDTLFDGEYYFLVRRCQPRDPILCSDSSDIAPYDFVRYDTDDALLVERIEVNGMPRIEWWEHVPCLLDADFDTGPLTCAGDQEDYFISGDYGFDYALPPDTLRDITYKRFDAISTYTGLVAGIGVIWIEDAKNTQALETLVYARISGEE